MNISFGLVSEGYTDQVILEGILDGFFNESEISHQVNYLSPPLDETDRANGQKAGWYQVFEYFKYPEIWQSDFQYNDYIIVQIDTDVSEEINYEVSKRNAAGEELTPDQLVDAVIHKFLSLVDQNLLLQYSDRIIFAISVHSIECWLLPIFGKTDSDKRKTVNCLKTLNSKLTAKFDFSIDPSNKSYGDYYEKLAGYFADEKRTRLIKLANKNPSFKIFIERLVALFP